MTRLADLGPCPYVDYLLEPPRLLAVGWLSGARRFPRGEVPEEVVTRLAGWLEALPPEPGQLVHQRGGVRTSPCPGPSGWRRA